MSGALGTPPFLERAGNGSAPTCPGRHSPPALVEVEKEVPDYLTISNVFLSLSDNSSRVVFLEHFFFPHSALGTCALPLLKLRPQLCSQSCHCWERLSHPRNFFKIKRDTEQTDGWKLCIEMAFKGFVFQNDQLSLEQNKERFAY